MKVILQKVQKKFKSDVEKALAYYSVIFALNNIRLPHKQLCLLAFTVVKGSITSPAARKEFIKMFDSSLASLQNMKLELARGGFLIQVDRKYRVNPQLALDFSKDIMLQVNLKGNGE